MINRRNLAPACKPLKDVLKYQNEEVVARFSLEQNVSKVKSRSIFQELKKWLWLCAQLSSDQARGVKGIPGELNMLEDQAVLDEMWHIFLLFTKDYQEFCSHYLGMFIHHVPTPVLEKNKFQELRRKKPREALQEFRNYLEVYYSYIYEKLGRRTLVKWANPKTTF